MKLHSLIVLLVVSLALVALSPKATASVSACVNLETQTCVGPLAPDVPRTAVTVCDYNDFGYSCQGIDLWVAGQHVATVERTGVDTSNFGWECTTEVTILGVTLLDSTNHRSGGCELL